MTTMFQIVKFIHKRWLLYFCCIQAIFYVNPDTDAVDSENIRQENHLTDG